MTLSGAPVIPPQSRYARQLPPGGALKLCRKLYRYHKSRPLGEGGCERSEQTEGVSAASLP